MCFTFLGYAIAIVYLFLDINERKIRTCAVVSQRPRFGCGTVLVLAARGSCITMAIATYRHQPSLFWLLCATNIPSVLGETQASYAFGKSPRSTSGGCWLRQASSVSEEPGDLCWILPDMEVGYNVGIVEMPTRELYFGIAVLDLNDWYLDIIHIHPARSSNLFQLASIHLSNCP